MTRPLDHCLRRGPISNLPSLQMFVRSIVDQRLGFRAEPLGAHLGKLQQIFFHRLGRITSFKDPPFVSATTFMPDGCVAALGGSVVGDDSLSGCLPVRKYVAADQV